MTGSNLSVPVRYAIPGRQIAVSLAMVFGATGVIAGLALVLRSAEVAVPVAFAVLGLMIWLMVKTIAAKGEAVVSDEGLIFEPRTRSLCAPPGRIVIAWENIVSVSDGNTEAGRPFVMMRTRDPQRSWIISPLKATDAGLQEALLERVNAVRTQQAAAPLESRRYYDSPRWRFAAWLSLILTGLAFIGALAAGSDGGWRVWRPVIMLACFSMAFSATVFGSKRRR